MHTFGAENGHFWRGASELLQGSPCGGDTNLLIFLTLPPQMRQRSLGVPRDSSVLQKPFDNAPVPPAMHDGNAEGQKSEKTSGNGGSEIDNVKPASP